MIEIWGWNYTQMRINKPKREKLLNDIKDITFWEDNRYYVWLLGFVLRVLITPFAFKGSGDYYIYRLPVAIGLSEGDGLYNDVHYNNMPIYPYITALAILIVGTENTTLTAVALKLPLAIADSFIPLLIYKIGIQIDHYKEGLITSLVYAVNPISLLEVQWARWDGFASMIVLLAFYLMLQKRPILFGLTVSFGFMLKQYPLFIFGLAMVCWKDEITILIKAIITFTLSTILVLALVLLPFNTSLNQMINDLSGHPIYQGEHSAVKIAYNCPPDIDNQTFCTILPELLIIIWFIVFMSFQFLSLVLYNKNPSDSNLIESITLQLTLLSLFFINRHAQFTLWLLPWLIFWGIKNEGKNVLMPIFLILGYFGLRFGIDHSIEVIKNLGKIILLILGLFLMVKTTSNLKSIEPQKEDNNPIIRLKQSG